ncbi:zinc-finger homeodomain protein 4-like [Prosopis cineraria]|uniref:zinc-finger homeodomain protein 4-like n=1 Tax=Prosopis cineraria TaxID=364024 RepID=UPI00240FA335|nr:zinc-finger homeodomain protein 4-like [Prosopis cineraria]
MDSSNYHVECKRASPSSSSTINEELKEQKKNSSKVQGMPQEPCSFNGGHAIDGCWGVISLEEDGSLEAFKCSACNCHQKLPQKEIQCYYSNSSSSNTFCYSSDQHYLTPLLPNTPQITSPIILDHLLLSPKKSGSNLSDQSHDRDSNRDHGEEDHRNHYKEVGKLGDEKVTMKKRFRTKFSAEQKEKMMRFAEKVGWKIQKLEESVVQKFCEEIGIKRRVLRVWLHNNKNTYAKNLRTTG